MCLGTRLSDSSPPAPCAPADTQALNFEYDTDVERTIRHAKRAARSELSVTGGGWSKLGLAHSNVLQVGADFPDTIARVDARSLTAEEFAVRFESPGVPVILTGLTRDWPASREWTDARLLERYGDHRFKVGSDDDGYAVRLSLRDFLYYRASREHGRLDDSPLYIFDGSFATRRGSRRLRQDYSVPALFAEDLMQHAGERRRPPYRWLVMGPARSGSGVHIDPLATSAWNALLRGHKRWALFPPGTHREVLRPPGSDREASSWFATVFRAMLGAEGGQAPGCMNGDGAAGGGGTGPGTPGAPPSPPQPVPQDSSRSVPLPDPGTPPGAPPGLIHCVQGPGDTIFVPAGWWHAVLNLDDTLAVTQNFCSSVGFARVWRHTRRGRPKMSQRWLARLRLARPDLAAQADDAGAQPGEGPDSASSSSSSSSSSSGSGSSSSSSSDEEDGEAEVGGESAMAKRPRVGAVPVVDPPPSHDAVQQPTKEDFIGSATNVGVDVQATM
ncbi:hypothetical protein ACKKBG_A07875 [Auxenochlorella protothecoides x Auxenochlorella symbiontica]